MKTKSFRLFIAVIVLALMSVSVVAAQDQEEPIYPLLSNGDSVTGTFDADTDGQLYTFYASAGDRVRINMAQTSDGSLLDPFLVLMSAQGQVIAQDNDGGDNPYFSALIQDAQIPEDGLYLVLATHAEGLRFALTDVVDEADLANGLDYTLTINGIATPRNVDQTVAFAPLDFGDSQTVALTPQNGVTFALIQAEAGDTIRLSTADNSGDGVDTLLALFNPDGARVAINDDAQGLGVNSMIEFEAEDEGFYLVMVTAYEFEMTGTPRFEWDQAGETTLALD